jgi:hypothetical protein
VPGICAITRNATLLPEPVRRSSRQRGPGAARRSFVDHAYGAQRRAAASVEEFHALGPERTLGIVQRRRCGRRAIAVSLAALHPDAVRSPHTPSIRRWRACLHGTCRVHGAVTAVEGGVANGEDICRPADQTEVVDRSTNDGTGATPLEISVSISWGGMKGPT